MKNTSNKNNKRKTKLILLKLSKFHKNNPWFNRICEGIKKASPLFLSNLIVVPKKTRKEGEATINIRQQTLMSFEDLMDLQTKPKLILILDNLYLTQVVKALSSDSNKGPTGYILKQF